ncbi:DUF7916 family protein [Ligilactobacillus murinus]|uniref:PEP phosphonomutase n=1 Tax=Ligilactobacillus murinus TaxID=1622 RepID=A0AAD0KZ79_9LACO|nr:haloacid dehalogenase-like hydrolase [Ligilactobacillus murinus]HBV48618.1 PEP phosphonomutase [Lactobacillus sp.]AWZ39121.1 PEP phosphonomutase [Ligilactobacillus murinus]AWZ40090.1 PEP phosphonomutase [Ligilactobacillus murinus]MCR1896394.1 haloacid dehalogenase-like hydrolase [Ligilactobacillus murinus]HCM78504.1 PEP phosphonomutase [Lactobacillus sp.]
MVKRLISADTSEVLQMSAQELKQSIKASEGRVVLSENFAPRECFVEDITNSEVASAFGADLLLLNGVDVFEPKISGLKAKTDEMIAKLHELTGRPLGVNLEPVDQNAKMAEDRLDISAGRKATSDTFRRIETLGFDFVCLTGNPGTGVTNAQIKDAIVQAKRAFSGLIIAGKMHGAGVAEPVVDLEVTSELLEAGADIILVPAVGTVPGFTQAQLCQVVSLVHQKGGLVLSAIGTSQESSDIETIKEIALVNKICGVDIQHIGDAGYGGVAPVENIYELSKAIRGVRHTVSAIARSINR